MNQASQKCVVQVCSANSSAVRLLLVGFCCPVLVCVAITLMFCVVAAFCVCVLHTFHYSTVLHVQLYCYMLH